MDWNGRLAAAVCVAALTSPAHSASAPVYLTDIQPVNASAFEGDPYDSTDPVHSVFLQPVAKVPGAGETHTTDHRLNVDFTLRNNHTDYIRLDAVTAHTSSSLPGVTVTGNDLLALPDAYLTYPLGHADLRRSILSNGGFSVTGQLLEERLHDEQTLPYGRAEDLVPVVADNDEGAVEWGYVIAGSYERLHGDPPTGPNDPLPTKNDRGFLALYDSVGNMLSYRDVGEMETISTIRLLSNGQLLVAGRYANHVSHNPARLVIGRYNVWETNGEGEKKALYNFPLDKTFGAHHEGVYQGHTYVEFKDGREICDVHRAVMIETIDKEARYFVTAHLHCGHQSRVGLVALDSDGNLDPAFGNGGLSIVRGPGNREVIPVGIAQRTSLPVFFPGGGAPPAGKTPYVWLGAALGSDCEDTAASSDCEFALNAFDPDSGALESRSWYLPNPLSNAQAVRPYDFMVDSFGRPVMAGVSFEVGMRLIAVHRFTQAGASDPSFGGGGWYVNLFDGHDAEARAVIDDASGDIVLGVLSHEPDGLGNEIPAMAMQKVSPDGLPVWDYSPYASGDLVMRSDVHREKKLHYGNWVETQLTGIPAPGLIQDWAGRYVTVGAVQSGVLQNPCAETAAELSDPSLDIGTQCGGPFSIAINRHLPIGPVDSRRYIPPNNNRSISLPEDRYLGEIPPSTLIVELQFDGYDVFSFSRSTSVFQNAVSEGPAINHGSYLFPFGTDQLANDERFLVKTHTLDHHHRHSSGSRFAYDISVVRDAGASGWIGSVKGGWTGGNEDYLVYMRPVRAAAGGKVIACRRGAPDATPGEFDSPAANFVRIQRYDGGPGVNLAANEHISYLHFAPDTVPEEICPPEKPTGDGDYPEYRPTNVEVDAGDLLGMVGSSGNSSVPHLHIELQTQASQIGGLPLLFRGVMLEAKNHPAGTPLTPVQGRAIAQDMLAFPQE